MEQHHVASLYDYTLSLGSSFDVAGVKILIGLRHLHTEMFGHGYHLLFFYNKIYYNNNKNFPDSSYSIKN